jgi:F420-dependent oxidoreductase-like protein
MALEAEALGFDSVWTAEAYGSDAVTPLAWIGANTKTIKLGTAIMQLPARSPACTAMTAMTLDALSRGRFLLGLGTSGPQVVEGWHGVPFGKPLTWLREYIAIVRKILARDDKLTFDGERYQIPFRGEGSLGLGKPLKSILHGRRDIPIYTGSMAPASQAFSAEVCDGLIMTNLHPERIDVVEENLNAGFAKSGGKKSLSNFDLMSMVAVVVGDDVDACRQPLKWNLALYVGGMGARSKNFYNDYAKRLGYEAAAKQIQDLFLAGKRQEATAAVPDKLIDECCLIGPAARIKDRLQAWKAISKEHKVGSLLLSGATIEALRVAAEAVL